MGLPVAAHNKTKPHVPTPSQSAPSAPVSNYEKTVPPEKAGDDPLPNSAVDDFFVKMNHDFRRPKPSEEAVAAALHAIQTLTTDPAVEPGGGEAATEDLSAQDPPAQTSGEQCPKCRAINSALNPFSGYCGTAL